jgi:hypothetical protein
LDSRIEASELTNIHLALDLEIEHIGITAAKGCGANRGHISVSFHVASLTSTLSTLNHDNKVD